jgi:hypothetical protein
LLEAMADEVAAQQHPRPALVQQDIMAEDAAARLADATNVDTAVSTLVTDPWTTHARSTKP